MLRTRRAWACLLVLPVVLASGLSASALEGGTTPPAETVPADLLCVHPFPCGDEWPLGVEGPFELGPIEPVRVTMSDGKRMEGWIARPHLPPGVRAPVLLHVGPYHGFCSTTVQWRVFCEPTYPGMEEYYADPAPVEAFRTWGVPLSRLVRRGYALAFFSVRGTGNSEDCFSFGGEREQQDQSDLIDWAAAEPWSNGRVAMAGKSYESTTALAGWASGNTALKTVVVAGIQTDGYLYAATPQGTVFTYVPVITPASVSSWTVNPPLGGNDVERGVVKHAPVVTDRACDDLDGTVELFNAATTETVGLVTDFRNQAFWDDRRLLDKFGRATAALLAAPGVEDHFTTQWQEDLLWDAAPASTPKWIFHGRWGHEYPTDELVAGSPAGRTSWEDVLTRWLDYWLKGRGPRPPRIGGADYQLDDVTWRRSSSWPPTEARQLALFLSDGRLSASPGAAPASFRSVPNPLNLWDSAAQAELQAPWADLCAPVPGTRLLFESDPLDAPVALGGLGFAYLDMTSDQAGGIVTLTLLDVGPSSTCGEDLRPTDAHVVAQGSADLRFHRGNFIGENFPVGTETPVRIDLWSTAEAVPAGRHLALLMSRGDPMMRGGQAQFEPELTIGPASHLVLPVVQGSIGVQPPLKTYPPRPFSPKNTS